MVPRSLFPLAVTATLLLLGATAQAQSSGVTIDPDSPAGKEYALPLDTARSGGGGTKDRSETKPRTTTDDDEHRELFGAGVGDGGTSNDGARDAAPATTPKNTSTTDRVPKRKPKARTTAEPSTTTERATTTEATTTDLVPAAVAATSDGGGTGPAIAIAGGVLLVGALAGLLLRGRPRRTLDDGSR